MSLLLEARKKFRQAQHAPEEGHAVAGDLAADRQAARNAGRNLFAAKSPAGTGFVLPSRGLLIALAVTILLLAAGLGYLWRLDSVSGTTPLHPAPIAATPTRPLTGSVEAPSGDALPDTIPHEATPPDRMPPEAPADTVNQPATQKAEQPRQATSPVRIERQRDEVVDPRLRDAYLAYRNGRTDEAQGLYQTMLGKDPRSADALLGLAAIAQQRGENMVAAQHYSRVLALDPRNAVAHAGMSALSTDDDADESRLKTLLREQGDSAVLHFALGNLFAGQARWGEAQQAYFNAYTLESGSAEFAYNLAVSLDRLGQADLSVRYYRRALQLDAARNSGFDHAQIERRIERLDLQAK